MFSVAGKFSVSGKFSVLGKFSVANKFSVAGKFGVADESRVLVVCITIEPEKCECTSMAICVLSRRKLSIQDTAKQITS